GAQTAPGLRRADVAAARPLQEARRAEDRGRRGQDRDDPRRHQESGERVIVLKSAREIDLMRRGGQILADVMEMLRGFVKPGLSTLEIDEAVEACIVARGAEPAFKGSRGFPAPVCISITEEIEHGLPSADPPAK